MKPRYFKSRKPKTLLEAINTVDWDKLIETCDKMNNHMGQLVCILRPRTSVQTILPEVLNPTQDEK